MRAPERTAASDAADKVRGAAPNRRPADGTAVRPGGRPLAPADVLALQRSAGNSAVLRLLAREQEPEPGRAHTGHTGEGALATVSAPAPAPVQRAGLDRDQAHTPGDGHAHGAAETGATAQSSAVPIQRSPHGAIGGVLKLGEAAITGVGEVKGLVDAAGDLTDARRANAQGDAAGSALGAYNNKVAGANVGKNALGVADTAIHATEGGTQIANMAEGGAAGPLSLAAGGIALPSNVISLARAVRKGWKADKRRRALRDVTAYEGGAPGPIAAAGADRDAQLKELQDGYRELRNLELSLAVASALIGASEEDSAQASASVRDQMKEVAEAIDGTLAEIEENARETGLARLELIRQYAEMKTQRRIAFRAADALSSTVGVASGAVGVAVAVGAAAATAGIAVGVAGGVVGAVVAGYSSQRSLAKRWKATAAEGKSGPRHLWDTVAVWNKIESERQVKSGQLFDYARSSDPEVQEFALAITDAIGVGRDVMQPDNANPTEEARKAAVKLLSQKLKSK